MDIKKKIDKMRRERGWTRAKLAKQAGITPNTVYNWYNEKQATPTRESIENVCVAYGISVASFYSDIDFNDLSEKEIELLEYYRSLKSDQQEAVVAFLKAFQK